MSPTLYTIARKQPLDRVNFYCGIFCFLSRVTSKLTMIQELKKAVKTFRKNVVFESCNSWTNRLYRMSQHDGDYLR